MAGNLTNRIGNIHKTSWLLGGGAGILLALLPLWFAGKPLPILYLLGADTLLPPLWLMGLLWLGVYALLGAAAVLALACQSRGSHADALLWRGMTFLVVEITFSLAWYSLLFGSFLLLPSWLCLVGAAVSGTLCLLSWLPLRNLSALLSLAGILWHIWLLLLQLAVILHN